VWDNIISDNSRGEDDIMASLLNFIYNNFVDNQYLSLKLDNYICLNVVKSILDSKLRNIYYLGYY